LVLVLEQQLEQMNLGKQKMESQMELLLMEQ
jgi:hypothetical protein